MSTVEKMACHMTPENCSVKGDKLGTDFASLDLTINGRSTLFTGATANALWMLFNNYAANELLAMQQHANDEIGAVHQGYPTMSLSEMREAVADWASALRKKGRPE